MVSFLLKTTKSNYFFKPLFENTLEKVQFAMLCEISSLIPYIRQFILLLIIVSGLCFSFFWKNE